MNERSLQTRWALLGLGAFALLLGLEYATESDEFDAADFFVDALSMALIVAAATGVAMLSGLLHRDREGKELLIRDLEMARAEGSAWRGKAQRYLSGLGEEIEKQFESWNLTDAEREVALLMLKGFSHREIAGLRGTTEATVRHQARAAYQKSGLSGRAAFCAYFLEDLLPGHQGESSDFPRT